MGAADVLARLRMDGFAVVATDDKLFVKPASVLTDDHRALIRQHRADLLDLLRDPDPRVTCTTCARYRPHRCRQHVAAGLQARDISRDFAELRQHCPSFEPV